MHITRPKTQYSSAAVLMFVGVFVWVIGSGHVAIAFDFHTDSAHGNNSYGVNRSGTECPTGTPCPTGDCTHCHDTFDDTICGVNPLMLFNPNYSTSQTENFCFECHKGVGTLQDPAFNNYNYTQRVNGYTYTYFPTNILDAFSYIDETGNSVYHLGDSTGTSHKLTDIKNFLDGRWGYTADSNPCTACHNPHIAQRDAHTAGSRGWPVSRPSGHTDPSTWQLWGDDANERMNQYTTYYQAPAALCLDNSPDTTYTIHHDEGSDSMTNSQRLDAGVWISLGTYPLGHDGVNDYVELAQSPDGVVIADALKYKLVESWDIIMDDADAAYVGDDWTLGGEPCYGMYGSYYQYSLKGDGTDTATWTPYIAEAGDYNVYARHPIHCYQPYTGYNAPYTVHYSAGSQTIRVDQRSSGTNGKWNLLGTFHFIQGTLGYVVLSDDIDCCGVAADAIKWEKVRDGGGSEEVIVDNPDGNGTPTEFWPSSTSLAGYYGDDYQYHNEGSGPDYFRWTITAAIPGTYEIFVRWVGVHEPELSATGDGSNLTDYVTFCTDCHNNSNTIYSNVLDRNLYTFDWHVEKHGLGDADDDHDTLTEVKAPYGDNTRYVLACTDCHEPHGTQNNLLIRPYVNNQWVRIKTFGTGYGPYPNSRPNKEWIYLCGRCHGHLARYDGHIHNGDIDGDDENDCTSCHGGGTYRMCGDCHYHGNTTIDGFEYGQLF